MTQIQKLGGYDLLESHYFQITELKEKQRYILTLERTIHKLQSAIEELRKENQRLENLLSKNI